MHPLILLRADAGQRIGTGHVMRCLALAQAWQATGGRVLLATREGGSEALEERLRDDGLEIVHLSTSGGSDEDAIFTAKLALQEKASWIVLDGYQFGSGYQKLVRRSGGRLLVIDDYGHAGSYHCDLILNQNVYAKEDLYRDRELHPTLLLGSDYVLLRREFWPWQSWHRTIPSRAHRILVTMGGSDPDNATLDVIRTLQEIEDLESVVVVGSSNPHLEELRYAVRGDDSCIRLVLNAYDMPQLMAWADMAITSGGTTCWEAAFMGLSSIVLVLAQNQLPVGESLDRLGVAINFGWPQAKGKGALAHAVLALAKDRQARKEQSLRGRKLVDGQGGGRVVRAMRKGMISLSPVTDQDCTTIYCWANDPVVRQASFNSDAISWAEHTSWIRNKLQDPSCLFLLATDPRQVPMGQVRFDITGNEAIISVSIAPELRGHGWGSIIIEEAVRELFSRRDLRRVKALIKEENQISARAFERACFVRAGNEMVLGNSAACYLRERGVEDGI